MTVSYGGVSSELTRFGHLRGRLIELHPDIDEQTLADTLEGATNLREALARLLRSALEDEALGDGLRALIDAMKSRCARLESRSAAKRQTVLEAMEAAGIPKFVEPDFTASLRGSPPSVVILSEEAVPAQF